MILKKYNYFIPFSKSTFIFKNKKKQLIALLKNYFLGFRLDNAAPYFCFINKVSNCMLKLTPIKNRSILSFWKKYLVSYVYFFFSKIKFKGKGFKLKKVKKTKNIKFFFGHSHKLIMITSNVTLKKIKKAKYQLMGTCLNKIFQAKAILKYIKPNNMYTKRGLRFTRQFILKRPGKKKTY